MRVMLMAMLLVGCGGQEAGTDTGADTGIAADTDTDTDTDTGQAVDPLGLIGSWTLTPCPCDAQPETANCSDWAYGLGEEHGGDGARFAPGLIVHADGTAELEVVVVDHVDGAEVDIPITLDWTWYHDAGGYVVEGTPWHVQALGELLTVSCGSGYHSLSH